MSAPTDSADNADVRRRDSYISMMNEYLPVGLGSTSPANVSLQKMANTCLVTPLANK